jgi:hypothetical protein
MTPEGLAAEALREREAAAPVAAVAPVAAAAVRPAEDDDDDDEVAVGFDEPRRPPGRLAANWDAVLLAIFAIAAEFSPRQGFEPDPRATVSSPDTRVTRFPEASLTSHT